MNLINVVFVALLGMLLSSASPTPGVVQTIQGQNNVTYSLVDLVFNLKINETHTVPVNGTIQDAFKQLAKHNPAQAATIKASIDNGIHGGNVASASLLTSSAQDDDDDCCTRVNQSCDMFSDANCDIITDGIAYLKGVSGTPGNGPGPGNCGRVSCSYGSAIYWCNDNPTPFVLANYSLIADGAQQVMNDCSFQQSANVCVGGFNGQQFYSGGWNVIVSGASC